MVMIDQVPWHEMEVDGELALQTEDERRGFETVLRQTLYSWRHMRVDMVVEPVIDVPKVIHSTGFGIETHEEHSRAGPGQRVVGHYYLDQLWTKQDVERNQDARRRRWTRRRLRELEAKAHEVFDGILEVRMQGAAELCALGPHRLHGTASRTVLLDLAVRPDYMHAMSTGYTDALLAMLDQLEEQGLLGYATRRTIHCTGAYTDELPAAGFDPAHPGPRTCGPLAWPRSSSAVSPAMHKEFELDYAWRWYERFGLGLLRLLRAAARQGRHHPRACPTCARSR